MVRHHSLAADSRSACILPSITCDNPRCIQPNQVLAFSTSNMDGGVYCSMVCYEQAEGQWKRKAAKQWVKDNKHDGT